MRLSKARAFYRLGETTINFAEETVIMGILNVTPDSFSDGGKYGQQNPALEHARKMLADGAKIIDIGGESTRPGYTPVSVEEEIARVVPVVELLAKELGCVISIDTSKAVVAEAAIVAGASIINDVWGAKREPAIAEVAARYKVPIILMHNRENRDYQLPFMEAVIEDLQESIDIAKRAGVSEEMIWLDPGIGFAKDLEQNLLAMQGLSTIADLGYPVLLGTSRKGMIGKVLDLPVEERMEGTGATVCYGIEHGGHIMRVHDVKEISRMVKMMDVLTKKAAYTG
ncbi:MULTISPECIES: dihydropteroate synthase [unclassified Sporosarcina]|uniref:dihydropteroate synthase n=1 Tax=unclassified Sporosarcina TaxID=2647733 RepID=UPI000C162922|nr:MULTISPECIES: dihydropteroate synthase [unclassified Sporosarcina]PID05117.1 dihydropteroate synthase [Sporosarcina sp. P30]PID08315.1 dihydropteroate synthase [Sporosarcina sp. P31]PID11394.1 dihydropteroate synthase [Sporosarcina sp. P32b]